MLTQHVNPGIQHQTKTQPDELSAFAQAHTTPHIPASGHLTQFSEEIAAEETLPPRPLQQQNSNKVTFSETISVENPVSIVPLLKKPIPHKIKKKKIHPKIFDEIFFYVSDMGRENILKSLDA